MRHFLALLPLGLVLAASCVSQEEDDCFYDSCNKDQPKDSVGGAGGTSDQAPREDLDCGTLVPTDQPITFAYLPTWTNVPALAAELDFTQVTHLALAFVNPSAVGEPLTFGYGTTAEEIAALVATAHDHNVKVLISIGGAAESSVVRELIAPEHREAYVDQLAAFVTEHQLDGVDVDIEGNSVDGTYEPFVVKLAGKLRPEGKLVTAAVGQWYAGQISARALYCFDYLNVMAYDYTGSWTPIEEAGEHSSLTDARSALSYWTGSRGYPKSRTVLGVPFYGYCWGSACPGSSLSYREIVTDLPEVTTDYVEEPDRILTWNTRKTLVTKARIARDYGGIMIWELSHDLPGPDSALSGIAEGLAPDAP